jgi:hypothetical protein
MNSYIKCLNKSSILYKCEILKSMPLSELMTFGWKNPLIILSKKFVFLRKINKNKLNMRLKITLQQAAGNALAIAGQTRHYALDSGFCHNISSHVGIMTLHDDTL